MRRRADEAVAWEHEVLGGTYGAPRIRHALTRVVVDHGFRLPALRPLLGLPVRRA